MLAAPSGNRNIIINIGGQLLGFVRPISERDPLVPATAMMRLPAISILRRSARRQVTLLAPILRRPFQLTRQDTPVSEARSSRPCANFIEQIKSPSPLSPTNSTV